MNKAAQTLEDLLVWRKAHLFLLAVYHLSMAFPKYEIYGLCRSFVVPLLYSFEILPKVTVNVGYSEF